MVQNTISSAIMVIAAVIGVAALIAAIYPSVYTSAGTLISASTGVNERTKTMLTISAHTFTDNDTILTFWVKNNGRTRITESELNHTRVYYGSGTGSMKNYNVTYTIVEPGNGDAHLDPAETLEVRLASDSLPGEPGLHRLKLTLPDGASCEYTFTI